MKKNSNECLTSPHFSKVSIHESSNLFPIFKIQNTHALFVFTPSVFYTKRKN